MQMYLAPKARFRSLPADFLLEEGRRPRFEPAAGDQAGEAVELDLEVLHAPGHCPGQVCLRAGQVLLIERSTSAIMVANPAARPIAR